MKGWRILAAAAVLGVPLAARAQDAPPAAPAGTDAPARHVNKVSDAAKALFDKAGKILYTPVKAGLKDLSGAAKFEMSAGTGDADGGGAGAPGGAAPGGAAPGGAAPGGGRGGRGAGFGAKMMENLVFAVDFKAPDDLTVGLKDVPGMDADAGPMADRMKQMKEQMAKHLSAAMSQSLRTMIEGFVPSKDAEFDADVKVDAGVTTLVMTSYLKGVEIGHTEFTIDANGLPSTGVSTHKPAAGDAPPMGPPAGRGAGGRGGDARNPDGKSTVTFSYAKEGDLFRLDKMTMETRAGPMESNLRYADAGGFKVVYAWEMGGPMGSKFGVKFSDLTVNGKVVKLPAPDAAVPPPAGKKDGVKEMNKGKEEDDEADEKDDEKGEGKEKK